MFPLRRNLAPATRLPDCHCEKSPQSGCRPRRPPALLVFKVCLAVLSGGLPALAIGQQYPALTIPADLKKDADAVVRSREYDIEIKSPSRAVIVEKDVITILNQHADDMAELQAPYSQQTILNSAEGTLYNSEGKELKHFKKKDMTDRPLWDGISLATDERIREASFTCHTYPYTVVFHVEYETSGISEIADWNPQQERNSAVEYSRYSITAPKGYTVRYKMLNALIEPVVAEIKDKVKMTWEIRNIKPVPAEPFAGPWNAKQPRLLVGPSDFEASGYKGSMSSWEEYGRFYSELSKGRDVLPDDIKARVHSLIEGQKNVRGKISVLYDYLQKNTHYISVQFGIGGLQTFDASYVSRNKYGDCKALSNYMMALLKEAGIAANVVLIRAGRNATYFQPDFPGNQFNHVICCVPLDKDTVWLECTDQYLPAGYVSYFTANRYGLMICDKGGKLVHTPDYALAENKQDRVIHAELDGEGNLKVKSTGLYRAGMQDDIEKSLHHQSRTEMEAELKKRFDLPTYDITAFDYQQTDNNGLPVMRESLDISVNAYAQISGKRLFIVPDLITRSGITFSSGETRERDLEFHDSYATEDSVEIAIPDGYEEEATPKDKVLKTAYGEYYSSAHISPGKIKYYRSFKQFRGNFPASSYSEASHFYNAVFRADREKIVLVKKQ